MAACHDAIRKAVTAHLLANGLRPRSGEGAHRIVLDYARTQLTEFIDQEDIEEADEIRRDRALAEYGDFPSRQLDTGHVRSAADVADRIVNAVAMALAQQAEPSRPRKR